MKRNYVIKCVFLILTSLSFMACSVRPQEINYGSDSCHFCSMTIVDKIHGAEIVTKKGKVFKYDAIECMVNNLKEIGTQNIALYLSNHYARPEELIDATEATFLISENLPSPMGAFLTAFEKESDVEKALAEKGGHLYTWDELLLKLNDKDVSNIREYP